MKNECWKFAVEMQTPVIPSTRSQHQKNKLTEKKNPIHHKVFQKQHLYFIRKSYFYFTNACRMYILQKCFFYMINCNSYVFGSKYLKLN